MKNFNVTVLAKWQVVIPKELRDEMWISVGNSLTCFARWSALVLKKKIETISYWSMSSGDQFPVGVESDGTTLSIAIDQFTWVTCLLWKAWFGKSVHALNMMVNMYVSWKSIIIFDPYGDRISEIKNYISDLGENDMYHYVVGDSNDRLSFKNKILQDKKQKIITISTNFQWIWSKKSAELSIPIILDCYKQVVHDDTAVFIDEFSIYFDEKLLGVITSAPWYTCILDQSWDTLSRSQIITVFDKVNHMAIYQVWELTAKYLVEDIGLSHTIQDLISIEKYHFYFHSTIWNKNIWQLLLSIYPLSY